MVGQPGETFFVTGITHDEAFNGAQTDLQAYLGEGATVEPELWARHAGGGLKVIVTAPEGEGVRKKLTQWAVDHGVAQISPAERRV